MSVLLHTFAARVGFALRRAQSSAEKQRLLTPDLCQIFSQTDELLSSLGRLLAPNPGVSPDINIDKARPEVSQLTKLFQALASPSTPPARKPIDNDVPRILSPSKQPKFQFNTNAENFVPKPVTIESIARVALVPPVQDSVCTHPDLVTNIAQSDTDVTPQAIPLSDGGLKLEHVSRGLEASLTNIAEHMSAVASESLDHKLTPLQNQISNIQAQTVDLADELRKIQATTAVQIADLRHREINRDRPHHQQLPNIVIVPDSRATKNCDYRMKRYSFKRPPSADTLEHEHVCPICEQGLPQLVLAECGYCGASAADKAQADNPEMLEIIKARLGFYDDYSDDGDGNWS